MQMHLWQDGLVAALAAIGLVSLLWAVTQTVSWIRRPAKRSAMALIPAQGSGGDLQEQVYTLTGFSRDHGIIGSILVVDCGLDEEGQTLCRILQRENRWVTLCRPEDVAGYLKDTT